MNALQHISGLFRRVVAWLMGSPYEGANSSFKRSYPYYGRVQDARFDAGQAVRYELVRKSRDLEKNNALFNALADLFEQYTVGVGLTVSPNSSDREWNARARASFDTWSRFADLTSLQPLGTIEGLWARRWFVDGEVFVILTYGDPDPDGRRRPRLKMYESHRCETPPAAGLNEGKNIIDGVEIDDRGRPVAYWFRLDTFEYWPQTYNYGAAGQPSYERIEAKNVIHIFEPSRFGEYRGVPMCHPCINEFTDLQDIDRLEMEAAKLAASRTDVVVTPGGTIDPESARRARLGGLAANSVPTANSPDLGQAVKQVTGVQPVVLPPNSTLTQYNSQRPSVVTQQYYIIREEKACAGIGIPRVLVFPGTMQGTQYRGALAAADAYFKARFQIIANAVRRVYEFWGAWAKVNERPLFDAPADWYQVSIQPPRAVNVDVGYQSAAMIAELQVGATNYERIYGPLGMDWREEFRKLKEQQDFAEEIGLVLSQPSPIAPAPAATEPDGDGKDDAEEGDKASETDKTDTNKE